MSVHVYSLIMVHLSLYQQQFLAYQLLRQHCWVFFLYHTFQSSENTTLVITPTSDHRMIRLWSRSPKQITAAFICESPGLSPGPLLVVFDSVISWSSALYCSPCCCCLGLIVCKKLHPHRHQGGGCRPAGAGGCPYKQGFRVRNIIPNQSALCTPNFTSFSLYLLKKIFI